MLSLSVGFVRRFSSFRRLLSTGAGRVIIDPRLSATSSFLVPNSQQKQPFCSTSPKNPSFYAVLGQRRAQAIDLYAMNERDFAAKVRDIDDKLWVDYMVAFSRPEGWMPTIPRTMYTASVRTNMWMKDNIAKATAHDFVDYVGVQANYLKLGGRSVQLLPDVRSLIPAWCRLHLQPTLDRDAFFQVVECLTLLPPAYQPILENDMAEKIVGICLRHLDQSEITWLLSFLRSMIKLQHPLDNFCLDAAGAVWAALNSKRPADSNDLCRSLLQIITPMHGSAEGRIGAKMISFPIRPPQDKSAWLVALMTLPFNDERFVVGRPLALKAIVLSIESHGRYLDLTPKDLRRYLCDARARYVEEPRLVFRHETNALMPMSMFAELLSVYSIVAQSKRPQFTAFRNEVENHNFSDHLLNEDFWLHFWQMTDVASQKKPLNEISKLLHGIRVSAQTDLSFVSRHMPAPFPARTHRWIDVCLERRKELAHSDDLIRLMICACPENAPKDTLIRLLAAYDDLDRRSHSRTGLGRMAAGKSQNLHRLAVRPVGSETPMEYHVNCLETAAGDLPTRDGGSDLAALYHSVQSLMTSSEQMKNVKDFMEAFFRQPELIASAPAPLQWLEICQQLKMRPSSLWWQKWCDSLLLPGADLSEDFSLTVLKNYSYLGLKYPDFLLPPIFFGNLKATVNNLTHQGKLVGSVLHLSRCGVRDTEIALLTEQRLRTLIQNHRQRMDVAQLIIFLHACTSSNIQPSTSWWSELNDSISKEETVFTSTMLFYLLLNSAVKQAVLFDEGSVPPSLVEWALKSLINRGCSFKEIEAHCQLRRLHLVFGDRPFIGAHSDFLAYLSRTEPPRLRSDRRNELVYVTEAAVWCSFVNFDKKECAVKFPYRLRYFNRDGSVDSSVLPADFAVTIKLLSSAGYKVRVIERR